MQQAEQRPVYTAGRPVGADERLRKIKESFPPPSSPLLSLHFSSFPCSPFLFFSFSSRSTLPQTLPSPSSASVPQRNLWGPRRGPIPTVEPTTVIARSSRPANQHSLLHFCSGRFREIHSTSHLSFDQSAQSLLLYYRRFILVPLPPLLPQCDQGSHRQGSRLIAIYL